MKGVIKRIVGFPWSNAKDSEREAEAACACVGACLESVWRQQKSERNAQLTPLFGNERLALLSPATNVTKYNTPSSLLASSSPRHIRKAGSAAQIGDESTACCQRVLLTFCPLFTLTLALSILRSVQQAARHTSTPQYCSTSVSVQVDMLSLRLPHERVLRHAHREHLSCSLGATADASRERDGAREIG